ncbi:HalOD1 output domain-containing protein [Natrialbaceae archaeon A-gly3]
MSLDTKYTVRRASSPEELRETILEAVAETTDESVTEPSSVFDTIDPAALTDLFVTDASSEPRPSGFLAFEFADRIIVVHTDGRVVVSPAERIRSTGTSTATREAALRLSEDAFESALAHVVYVSFLNGADVEGSWSLREASPLPDWEVEITEVTKPVFRVDT